MSGGVFRSAERPGVIDRAVYGTIVVTSVLVLYDEVGEPEGLAVRASRSS